MRIIKPDPGTPAGAVKLFEDSPREKTAEIWCRLGYWNQLPDGRLKTYRSPWVAAKSRRLAVVASRCPDYRDEP